MLDRVTRRDLLTSTGAASGGLVLLSQGTTQVVAQTNEAVTIDRTLGDEVFLPPTADATVTGTSTVNPGSALEVRISSSGDSPFFRVSDAVVADDGGWMTSFDLSGVPEGTEILIAVYYQNEPLARAPGVIRTLTASLAFNDQVAEASGTIVFLETVTLEVGGFVSIHEETPRGPIIGVSQFLDADQSYAPLEISLDRPISGRTTLVATAHVDTDRDQTFDPSQDQPYVVDGERVFDEADVQGPAPPVTTTTETVEPTQTTAVPTQTRTPVVDGSNPPIDIVVGGAGGVLGTVVLREARKRWDNNHPPEAKIWYSPNDPEPGRPIIFDGRQSSDPDPDDTIVRYQWSIDGDDKVTPRFVHSFMKAGEYDVTLAVTDGHQNTDTQTETITVESHQGDLDVHRINPDSPGDDHSNLNQEYLVFENAGDDGLELGGWTIHDAAEEEDRVREGEHTFTFPRDFDLDLDATVTIHTGSASDDGERYEESKTARHLFWEKSRAVWNNEEDIIVVADDRENPVMAKRYWRTEEGSYELEDLDMEILEDWFPTVVLSTREDTPPVDVRVDEGFLRSWLTGLLAFFAGSVLLRGPREFLWSWGVITGFFLSFWATWEVSTGLGLVTPSIEPLALVGVTLPAAGTMIVGGVVWVIWTVVVKVWNWLR